MNHSYYTPNATFPSFLSIGLLIIIMSVSGFAYGSQDDANRKSQDIASLRILIEESLLKEKINLAELEKQKESIHSMEKAFDNELEAYKLQHTTYTNMLAVQDTRVKAIERSGNDIEISMINIKANLDYLFQKSEEIKQFQLDSEEQYIINTTHLSELKASKTKLPDDMKIIRKSQTLINIIANKRNYLKNLQQFYTSYVGKYEEIRQNLLNLKQKIDLKISEKKKSDLFQRKKGYPIINQWSELMTEGKRLADETRSIFSISKIKNHLIMIWKSKQSFIFSFFLLFCMTLFISFRLRMKYARTGEHTLLNKCPRFDFAIQIFNRSIYLFTVTLFLYIYSQTGFFYSTFPVAGILLSLLQVYLFTRWLMDTIKYSSQNKIFALPSILEFHSKFFFSVVRIFGFSYVIILFLSDPESSILFFVRLLFEIYAFTSCIIFWEKFRKVRTDTDQSKSHHTWMLAIKILTYFIFAGALLMEIAGYGFISLYWYVSWGKSIIIILWFFLIFLSLKELGRVFRVNSDSDDETTETSGSPVKWLLIKSGQLILCAVFFISLIITWGGEKAFLLSIYHTLNKSYQIGNMQFSFMGFVYALIVLLITQTIAKFWRFIFQRKILAKSGMKTGLQESITTISIYSIWIIGILISLHAFGLNTTSLAVAFGALGIGLGFGLQSIFNNFVSGIILLFERPIEVGDDIEVNGLWATVKKINVRSTVVQTYDNASLIIPNSELVSNQVTNWSFKDKRLRRSIMVGVSYGSDVEMVRQSLLETAATVPRVLKYPKPDVLFTDFGDNALIFKLRFWTHVSHFYAVETEVRFEIDRLFRERNITIAFPQRDIHLYQKETENNQSPKRKIKK
jgi:potassium-dependent mechanosensitive channel